MKTILLALLATAILGFCQEPSIQANTNPNMMPVSRTLTSADGRTIDVVITAKTTSGVTAKKADGKEFEIALDKLSDADKAFVAGLVEPTVKKTSLLFVLLAVNDRNKIVLEKLKAAGYDVKPESSIDGKDATGTTTPIWPGIDKMSDQQIKDYDVVWVDSGLSKRYKELLPTYQGAMVMMVMDNNNIKDFLKGDSKSNYGGKPHVDVDKNLIRYYDRTATWKGQGKAREFGPQQPEFIDQAIAEVKKLLKK